ncbi:spc105-related isoform X2 [Musca autumnalis]|uniref:spc105-related isoform X2 n=1 Tax=Musca autumnalis TaxID=221902 RepID=UPI003CEA5318
MDLKKRRSSLRKYASKDDENTVPSTTPRLKRRISFSGKRLVREFRVEEVPKNWDNSYEISDHMNAEEIETNNGEKSNRKYTHQCGHGHSEQTESPDPCDETFQNANDNTLKNLIDKSLSINNILCIENSVDITLYGNEKQCKNNSTQNSNRSNINSFSLDENELINLPYLRYKVCGERTVDFMSDIRNDGIRNNTLMSNDENSATTTINPEVKLMKDGEMISIDVYSNENITVPTIERPNELQLLKPTDITTNKIFNVNKDNMYPKVPVDDDTSCMNIENNPIYYGNSQIKSAEQFSIMIDSMSLSQDSDEVFKDSQKDTVGKDHSNHTINFNQEIQISPRTSPLIGDRQCTDIDKEMSPNKTPDNKNICSNTVLRDNYVHPRLVVKKICTPLMSNSKNRIGFQTRLFERYQSKQEKVVPSNQCPAHDSISNNSATSKEKVLDNSLNFSISNAKNMSLSPESTSSLLIPSEYRAYNFKQLNDEIEGGKIQLFTKTPTTDRKLKYSNFEKPLFSKNRKTLFFDDNIVPENIADFSSCVEKENYYDFNVTRTKIRNGNNCRFSYLDDGILDTTSFLTKAKLGDESVSRNNTRRDFNNLHDIDIFEETLKEAAMHLDRTTFVRNTGNKENISHTCAKSECEITNIQNKCDGSTNIRQTIYSNEDINSSNLTISHCDKVGNQEMQNKQRKTIYIEKGMDVGNDTLDYATLAVVDKENCQIQNVNFENSCGITSPIKRRTINRSMDMITEVVDKVVPKEFQIEDKTSCCNETLHAGIEENVDCHVYPTSVSDVKSRPEIIERSSSYQIRDNIDDEIPVLCRRQSIYSLKDMEGENNGHIKKGERDTNCDDMNIHNMSLVNFINNSDIMKDERNDHELPIRIKNTTYLNKKMEIENSEATSDSTHQQNESNSNKRNFNEQNKFSNRQTIYSENDMELDINSDDSAEYTERNPSHSIQGETYSNYDDINKKSLKATSDETPRFTLLVHHDMDIDNTINNSKSQQEIARKKSNDLGNGIIDTVYLYKSIGKNSEIITDSTKCNKSMGIENSEIRTDDVDVFEKNVSEKYKYINNKRSTQIFNISIQDVSAEKDSSAQNIRLSKQNNSNENETSLIDFCKKNTNNEVICNPTLSENYNNGDNKDVTCCEQSDPFNNLTFPDEIKTRNTGMLNHSKHSVSQREYINPSKHCSTSENKNVDKMLNSLDKYNKCISSKNLATNVNEVEIHGKSSICPPAVKHDDMDLDESEKLVNKHDISNSNEEAKNLLDLYDYDQKMDMTEFNDYNSINIDSNYTRDSEKNKLPYNKAQIENSINNISHGETTNKIESFMENLASENKHVQKCYFTPKVVPIGMRQSTYKTLNEDVELTTPQHHSITEFLAYEKNVERECKSMSCTGSPIVNEPGSKRLPIHLTPLSSMAKKRQTVLFADDEFISEDLNNASKYNSNNDLNTDQTNKTQCAAIPESPVDDIENASLSIQEMRKAVLSRSPKSYGDTHTQVHVVETNIPAELFMLDDKAISISDVSEYFDRQRKSIVENLNASTGKCPETINGINFQNCYMNLTCDNTLAHIDQTTFSLVKTISDDDDDEYKNDKEGVQNLSEIQNGTKLNVTTTCRKCKRCQQTFVRDNNESLDDSFCLPAMQPIPTLDLNRLKRLRRRPHLSDVNTLWQRVSLDRTVINTNEMSISESTSDCSVILEPIKSYMVSIQRMKINVNAPFADVGADRKSSISNVRELSSIKLSRWIVDTQLENKCELIFVHRTLLTLSIIFTYEELDKFGSEIQIRNVELANDIIPTEKWKPIDFVLDFNLKLRLPIDLLTFCKKRNANGIFEIMEKVDDICTQTINMGIRLQQIVYGHGASIIRDQHQTFVYKVVRRIAPYSNQYPPLDKLEFKIELLNLNNLSYKDISMPSLHKFCKKIHLLPNGIQFLNNVLKNPLIYLNDI